MIRTIANALPGMIAYWDKALTCRFANQAYQEWFGKDPSAVVGLRMPELLGDRLFAMNEPYVLGALAGQTQTFERTLVKANGSVGHTLANYIPHLDPDGAVIGFFVLVSDVTSLKKAQAGERLAASVYDSVTEAIIVSDASEVIVSVNRAFTEITGFAADEAIGRTTRILGADRDDEAFRAAAFRQIAEQGRWQGEIWSRRKNGEAFLAAQTTTAICGEPVHYVSVFQDVTDWWRKNERLRRLASHDALTDLPNRVLLMDRLNHLLSRPDHASEQKCAAVMFLDLDRFKAVNDTLGHDAGDCVLQTVARTLRSLVRHTDTVARLSGDEFVILLDHPMSRDEMTEVAQRIVVKMSEPILVQGNSAQLGISIGIAATRAADETPAELLAKADAAMYAAKAAGRNCFRFAPGTWSEAGTLHGLQARAA